ncbi:sorcin-like isoform X2 [Styela clava]
MSWGYSHHGSHHGAHSGYGHHQQSGYYPHPQQPQLPPGCPPGIDPVVFYWFQSVDQDGSKKISADELRTALMNNKMKEFNHETCRLMIGMFDKNNNGQSGSQARDGQIDIHEFSALWGYIQQWRQCFDSFDTDRSGNIDANELSRAFATFGYRLSMDFTKLVVRQFDRTSVNTIDFDDFIQVCVMLKTLTDKFREKDRNQNGNIQLRYEEFLEMVLDNTLNMV